MSSISTLQAQSCQSNFNFSRVNGLSVYCSSTSTASSGATINSYSWDFGDGTISTLEKPNHNYGRKGAFSICLTITDSRNCSSTSCDSVKTSCWVSIWSIVDSLQNARFRSYTLVDSSYSFSWDFGDSSAIDTTRNPTHHYTNIGTYDAKLIITNGVDTCMSERTVEIKSCFASFTTKVENGLTVSVTNHSQGGNSSTSYYWDFGDSTISTLKNPPPHTYTRPVHSIIYSMYDSLNNCTSAAFDTIDYNHSCKAGFTIEEDTNSSFTVNLYNISTNVSSHKYSWDFGDGNTGSGRTPTHSYQNVGMYQVCLTVTDSILQCDTSIFCDSLGMDSLGNLKAGFSIVVKDQLVVGIEEERKKESFANLVVYPNPASTQVNINLEGIENEVYLSLMDLSGRKLIEQIKLQGGGIQTLDLSSVEKGIYFLLFNNGEQRTVKKIIVSN